MKCTEWLVLQLWLQGAHRLVLMATFFPLHGALQTLPVTSWELGTHRSPHAAPLQELLTPVGG